MNEPKSTKPVDQLRDAIEEAKLALNRLAQAANAVSPDTTDLVSRVAEHDLRRGLIWIAESVLANAARTGLDRPNVHALDTRRPTEPANTPPAPDGGDAA